MCGYLPKLDIPSGPGKGGPQSPFFQSQRLDLYHAYAKKLLDVTYFPHSLLYLISHTRCRPFSQVTPTDVFVLLTSFPSNERGWLVQDQVQHTTNRVFTLQRRKLLEESVLEKNQSFDSTCVLIACESVLRIH